jgi:hypothetical protein
MSSSNPFMAMLAALEEGSSSQPDRAANENVEAGTGRNADIKLPEFWPQAPVLWFSRAECIFTLRHVEDEVTKYCAVVACLPHDVLRQVADLLDIAALTEPYKQLKDRLLSANELTPIQRAERVMQMADLGGQKPSQLLAAMLEWCPRGEERSPFFIASFLRRLPNELRILLAHEDFSDLKAVSQKADALWQLCPRLDSIIAAVAALDVDDTSAPIAGVGQWPAKGRSAAQSTKKKGSGKKSIVYCWKHHQYGRRRTAVRTPLHACGRRKTEGPGSCCGLNAARPPWLPCCTSGQ